MIISILIGTDQTLFHICRMVLRRWSSWIMGSSEMDKAAKEAKESKTPTSQACLFVLNNSRGAQDCDSNRWTRMMWHQFIGQQVEWEEYVSHPPTNEQLPSFESLFWVQKTESPWNYSFVLLNFSLFVFRCMAVFLICFVAFGIVQEQTSATSTGTVNPDWSGFQVPLLKACQLV